MLSVRKNIQRKKVFKKKYARFKNISVSNYKKDPLQGFYKLYSLESGPVTFKQIESARRSLLKSLGRTCRIWIRVFPDQPVTKKSLGIRMGSGVGRLHSWCFNVKVGHSLFEISNPTAAARSALFKAAKKLPIRCHVSFALPSTDRTSN